jgi:hypothetical protein
MKADEKDVAAALKLRFGTLEFEIERMLGFYQGRYETVTAFFQNWLTERLGEQAGWMLKYIHVEQITAAAVALGRISTMPASQVPGRPPEVYVFLFKP